MPTLQNVTHEVLDPPLRGEPFSAEHLWNYAETFAATQVVRRGGADRRLVDRFEDNSRFIAETYRVITESIRSGEPLAPGRRMAGRQLLRRRRPAARNPRRPAAKLLSWSCPNLPRGLSPAFRAVYELAHELVVHSDSSLDEELIAGFIAAYQRAVPLTSGEIWAVPIMLRLVLVENLRRICRAHAGRPAVPRAGMPDPAAMVERRGHIAGISSSTTTAPCSSRS